MHSLPTSKYWIKILCRGNKKRKSDKLVLKNVSIDFIKGIYCGLYDPIEEKPYEKYIIIKSDLKLKKCINNDIIAAWSSGGEELFLKMIGIDPTTVNDLEIDEKESRRSNILKNSEKYNSVWNKLINKLSSELQYQIKRFFGVIQAEENYFVVQFDSIDFLNGFETVRLWKDSHPQWITCLQLIMVFESHKLCKINITYQIPQKEKDYLLHIFECVQIFLPKVLAREVVYILAQQCTDYDKNFHNTYDECHSFCTNSVCHIHQRKPKDNILRLKHCLARITLEHL